MEIKAVIFDVFGTVVDWRSGVATVCADCFLEKNIVFDPYEFADLWRAEYQPTMEKIRSGNRGYVPLDILHLENLNHIITKVNLSELFDENEKHLLNKAWEKLPPWPESIAGLNALAKQFTIAPCSNGSVSLMTNLAKFGELPWHTIVGAEIAKNYKPHPSVYQKSVEKLGLKANQVIMAACHNEDLVAARKAGLKTAFFPRPTEHGPNQSKDLEATSDWDFIAKDLEDFSNQLCA